MRPDLNSSTTDELRAIADMLHDVSEKRRPRAGEDAPMVERCFTGQSQNKYEEVHCTKCGGLVNTRYSGWLDKYASDEYPDGAYVHYQCLSARRLAEINEKQ